MSALKPCPFCGERSIKAVSRGVPEQWVYCHVCDASGPVKSDMQHARAAWNRRAGDEEVEKLRAEVATLQRDNDRLRKHGIDRDNRIRQQRANLRVNWQIVENRRKYLGSPEARQAYLRLHKWHDETRAELAAAREALRNAADAIERADPEILTCTLWMPDDVSPNETIVDHLRTALGDTP